MKLAIGVLLVVLGIQGSIAAYKTVCYHSSWAHYRNGDGKFGSDDIDPHICTHLIYAFAGLNNDFTVHTLDAWLSEDSGLGDYRKFTDLKLRNKNLKTLIGIGGWNEDSARFSRMVSTQRNRQVFIDSVIQFIKEYDFDGLNLDWQYPANRGGLPVDKRNFVELLKELRQAFDREGFVLGISAAGNPEIINSGYDVAAVTQAVDYVSLLSYDYHGGWETKTGMNAPLYPKKSESALDKTLNQDSTVSLWLKKGADPAKILLGIPAYGRTYMLRSQSRNKIGDPAARPGNPGPYTQQDGYLGYNEIIEKFSYETGWVVEFDDEQKVPFAYNRDFWIGYDNPQSVSIKADYVVQKKLGGAMIWSLETEDFLGLSNQGKFPLITAIQTVFNGGQIVTSTTDDTPVTPGSTPGTQKPPPGKCVKEGTMRHDTDCTKYITCIKSGRDNQFQAVVNTCPSGLAFDETLNSCNWRDAVPGC